MSATPSSFSSVYRIVLLGTGGVGKTTFVDRLCHGNYEKEYCPTSKTTRYPLTLGIWVGGRRTSVNLELIDTPGHEDVPREACYRIDFIVALYDITFPATLPEVRKKVERVYYLCDAGVPTLYVANKIDLSRPDLEAPPPDHHAMSSRTCFNVHPVLEKVLRRITRCASLTLMSGS